MDTTANPDLAALSAAATQGEWIARDFCQSPATPKYPAFDTVKITPQRTTLGSLKRADGDFIVALVNAYRTGNLVQIDREGMREVLARAYSQGATDVHNCWINDGGQWDADFGEASTDYAHAD